MMHRSELTREHNNPFAEVMSSLQSDAGLYLSEERSSPVRLAKEIGQIDLLHWLSEQQVDQKIYWRGRDGNEEVAGVGSSIMLRMSNSDEFQTVFREIKETLSRLDGEVRFYGGMRFDSQDSNDNLSSEWKDFSTGLFLVPILEVIRKNESIQVCCNLTPFDCNPKRREEILSLITRSCGQIQGEGKAEPTILSREDMPSQDGWSQRISLTLNRFESGITEKIVLARRSDFKMSSQLRPWSLLEKLRAGSHDTYLFGVQPSSDKVFIGASPERLYSRKGGRIESEALAGTRRRGESATKDEQLAGELLSSEKDRREHQLVVTGVRDALASLCVSLESDRTVTVRKLARVQHLACHFRGELARDVDDYDLINSLHPTPAVGGMPRKKATAEIEAIEKFDRGWYCGPVGWIGKDQSDFAVAIRSGLVHENHLLLYAGAGIVRGSLATEEWDEIETKISNFLQVIGSP